MTLKAVEMITRGEIPENFEEQKNYRTIIQGQREIILTLNERLNDLESKLQAATTAIFKCVKKINKSSNKKENTPDGRAKPGKTEVDASAKKKIAVSTPKTNGTGKKDQIREPFSIYENEMERKLYGLVLTDDEYEDEEPEFVRERHLDTEEFVREIHPHTNIDLDLRRHFHDIQTQHLEFADGSDGEW